MSDTQRIEWERDVWQYICRIYYSIYRAKLPPYSAGLRDKIDGFAYERLDDLVNAQINPQKMAAKLYGILL